MTSCSPRRCSTYFDSPILKILVISRRGKWCIHRWSVFQHIQQRNVWQQSVRLETGTTHRKVSSIETKSKVVRTWMRDIDKTDKTDRIGYYRQTCIIRSSPSGFSGCCLFFFGWFFGETGTQQQQQHTSFVLFILRPGEESGAAKPTWLQ
jgi:hypothetical protein